MGVALTDEMIQAAQATEKKYGVPASVTLAQVMLESGGTNPGGLSGLAYKYNNYFGVTAGSSWQGKTVTMSNKAGTDTKTYRVYDSVVDSFNDHAKVLQNERYTKYTKSARTAEEYVDGVAKGGYAEDKGYADKLKNLIATNRLTQYDGGFTGSMPVTEGKTKEEAQAGEEGGNADLKWWGDIILLVIIVLVAALGIVFFISSFSRKNPDGMISRAAKKIKGKGAS